MNLKLLHTTKLDYILSICLIMLCLSPLFSLARKHYSHEKRVIIYKQSEIKKEAELNQNQIITIDEMEIHIDQGKTWVSRSDCPHQICVHTGKIEMPSQTIVCVPNRVLVEITGRSLNETYNAVSY